MRGSNRDIAKKVKICTYCCYVRCATLIVWVRVMPWPQTGATQYHAQLGLPVKGRANKRLVVSSNWDLKPLDLLKGLALRLLSTVPWGINRKLCMIICCPFLGKQMHNHWFKNKNYWRTYQMEKTLVVKIFCHWKRVLPESDHVVSLHFFSWDVAIFTTGRNTVVVYWSKMFVWMYIWQQNGICCHNYIQHWQYSMYFCQ